MQRSRRPLSAAGDVSLGSGLLGGKVEEVDLSFQGLNLL